MKKAPLPKDEAERLQTLRDYEILDTSRHDAFDELTQIAADVLGMPIALISLVDEKRQWFKSRVGLDATETSRDVAFCAHAILGQEIFEVTDAFGDERFFDNPLVTGAPNIRFYAGVPLAAPNGHNLGTLCVLDVKPRSLDEKQKRTLKALAHQVVQLFELRRLNKALKVEIHEHKKAEEKLKEQILAIDRASDGIAILNAAGEYTFLSRAHLDIFGYSAETELLGKPWTSLYSAEEIARFQKEVFPVLGSQGYWSGEATAIKNDGTTFDEEVSLAAVEGGGLVCVCRDVSERKRKDRDLQEATERALTVSRLKSDFIASVSHEIRTPMNGILGLSSLLRETELNSEQGEYVDLIDRSGRSLLRIINEILDFSKIESGKLNLVNEEFHLKEMVENCLGSMVAAVREKKLELRLSFEDLEDLKVFSDPGRIGQILSNLVANSIKFTESGVVAVKTTVRSATSGDNKKILRIEVHDTGLGISDQLQKKLFDPFTQEDSSMIRKFGGTGLGLSICKKLVKLMDGEIGFSSHMGRGSMFWFEIPLASAS